MSECWRKVIPASAFLSAVSCLSPASVFRHSGLNPDAASGFSPVSLVTNYSGIAQLWLNMELDLQSYLVV